MNTEYETEVTPRAGRCAIVGRPNVGKSTLLNALLGQKLVIATSKPGTTRSSVLGVVVQATPPTQIAFVDTPGLHRPKSVLGKVLVEQARLGLVDVDAVVFVTEPPRRKGGEDEAAAVFSAAEERVFAMVRESGRPTILAINKVDRVRDKLQLLPMIKAYAAHHDFAAILPISAAKKMQLDALVGAIRELLPEGRLYEEDVLTDRPERFFVAEMVREAAMNQTWQEVPHGVACTLDEFYEDGHITRITATLIVEKPAHKGIVLGAKGSRIKAIGTAARMNIERFLGKKVFLKLWVKVMPGWTNNPTQARRLVTEVAS